MVENAIIIVISVEVARLNGLTEIINRIEMPQLDFLTGIPEPYRTILFYAILAIGAVVVCLVVGFVLKLLLKILFKPIKFAFCAVLVFVLLGIFLVKSAISPIQSFVEESGVGEVMAVIVDEFKGLYSQAEPLLAWRFTDVTEENTVQAQVFGENAEQGKTYIRIDYLPAGSVVVEYDQNTGEAQVVKEIGQ